MFASIFPAYCLWTKQIEPHVALSSQRKSNDNMPINVSLYSISRKGHYFSIILKTRIHMPKHKFHWRAKQQAVTTKEILSGWKSQYLAQVFNSGRVILCPFFSCTTAVTFWPHVASGAPMTATSAKLRARKTDTLLLGFRWLFFFHFVVRCLRIKTLTHALLCGSLFEHIGFKKNNDGG